MHSQDSLCNCSSSVDIMGPVWTHHRWHKTATHSAGWQAKMASIEFWIPWHKVYRPHCIAIGKLSSAHPCIAVWSFIFTQDERAQCSPRASRTVDNYLSWSAGYSPAWGRCGSVWVRAYLKTKKKKMNMATRKKWELPISSQCPPLGVAQCSYLNTWSCATAGKTECIWKKGTQKSHYWEKVSITRNRLAV